MNVSLYEAASALNANSRWQELIAENIASSSVPGFKKRELSFAAASAGLLPQTPVQLVNDPSHFMMPRVTAATNFAPGEMKATGVLTDLAIEGPAFFTIQLPNGGLAYTRDGEFQLNSQGQLVTKEGYLVLSDAGPIQMDPRISAPLAVSADGEISQGEDLKGRLALVEFDNPNSLIQISGGLFLANNANAIPVPAAESTIRQGFLESANINPAFEMANLITSMRHFETNQRIIQMQDERIGRMIQELGNPA